MFFLYLVILDSYNEKEWIWIFDVDWVTCFWYMDGFYPQLMWLWAFSTSRNRLAVDTNDKSLMALDYWDKAYINGLSFRCSSSFLSLSHKPKWTLSLGRALSMALGPYGSRDYRSLIGSRVTQVHAKWAYNGNLLVCYPSSNIT